MDILIIFFISFLLLLYSVLKGFFIGYVLFFSWILFALVCIKKGYKMNEILKISYKGGKKSFIVLKVFILIGMIISSWMVSGTIPTIIYYCLKYITPHSFILSSFLICCITSFLIGTAFGTVSTVGIPLIILAASGHVNLNITAGAIISGAYFGDRCSPMSSSAILVANLTETNIFINIKNMIYSSLIPLILSLIFYYNLSINNPLKILNNTLSIELFKNFNIKIIMFLPALIILILSLRKIKLQTSILVSILCACTLSIMFQHYSLYETFYCLIFGFKLNAHTPLQNIIKGGGIVSMLKTCFIVFVSCSLTGIFEELRILDKLKERLSKLKYTNHKLFFLTSITSMFTASFGCNQSIAVIMTNEIMKSCYDNKFKLALALENSSILIPALIPWNIAALVPTSMLNVNTTGFIPYAFYLYILPVTYLIQCKIFNINNSRL